MNTVPRSDVPAVFEVLGTKLVPLDLEDAWSRVARSVGRPNGGYLVFANVHVTVEAVRNSKFDLAIRGANMVLPDSAPLLWAARARGHRLRRRVYGPDFMRHALDRTRDGSVRHFFYGSSEETLARLRERTARDYPGAVVCGAISPPYCELSEEEMVLMADRINVARPDIVWVGLGCPRQELWMSRQADRVRASWMAGVGQAFDQIAATRPQAPSWMQKAGLEWCFRLYHEPRRLGPRYLVSNLLFVWYLLLEKARLKSFAR
jgi:N-acetylglucosaminyldiphosphoundecaprenol N-acetyl-beta-D-mannosaminyltransferase